MARAPLVVALLLAACEPGFPLPTVSGPSATWSPTAPDPHGPCLQTTRLRKRSWLWKRGVEQSSLVDATADDPSAYALARRARTLDRLAMSSALAGMGLWWSGVLLVAELPTRDEQLGVGLGGGALAIGGFATTVVAAIHSGRDRARAIDVYNESCPH